MCVHMCVYTAYMCLPVIKGEKVYNRIWSQFPQEWPSPFFLTVTLLLQFYPSENIDFTQLLCYYSALQ